METELTAPHRFSSRQVTDAIRAGLKEGRRPVDLSPTGAELLAAAYRGNLIHYHQHVRKSLDEGDYLQAAEKSWGVFAQAVKAIAADRRLRVRSHASILRVSEALVSLVASVNPSAGSVMDNGFNSAHSLHIHFYENDLPDATVIRRSDAVVTASALLQKLFPPEQPELLNGK